MKQTNQSGFTLIELIIVIVILGILAVTAAPRFIDFQNDARVSAVKGLEGALKGGLNIVYSKAIIENKTGADSTLTDPDVELKYGYPDATVDELSAVLDASLGTAADTDPEVDWEVVATEATGTDAAFVRIYPVGDYAGNTTSSITAQACYVQYTEAADADTPATVTSDTDDC